MNKQFLNFIFSIILVFSVSYLGCGNADYAVSAGKLITEPVGIDNPGTPDSDDPPGGDSTGQDIPSFSNDGHPIFQGMLGVPVASISLSGVERDETGLSLGNDFDGDGILNDLEVTTNPYVADYPKVVTRISAPITMEIRKEESTITENHTETIEATDLKETMSNSMEDKHYSQMNLKTTPYVTKESYDNSVSHSDSFGFNNTDSFTKKRSGSMSISIFGCGGGSVRASGEDSESKTRSENSSVSDTLSSAAMTEKTVFEDVDYSDNLDRNGVEYREDTVQNITKNYRKSEVSKSTYKIGPNAGYVRAALFIKNLTVNIPVRVSNVICTLSFRTPAGEFLPVKTFRLRNEDYSEFDQEIYGDTELGPYSIEVSNLNTHEVKKALANGYIPQIHIVSYDMHRVEDSNYNPGVDNLKIVEETAKGRTAVIKILGNGIREMYRVAAFDEDSSGISPGISLKKALFYIFRDRIGNKENWIDEELTVRESGLKWKASAIDPEKYIWEEDVEGNSWRCFETYIKEYTDEYDAPRKIETIKRIGALEKYNPFSIKDNPAYDANELISEDEIRKMKYWVVLHNGRYFEGDINDPIWAGERYEIICVDVGDFNKHYRNFYYTPLQSMQPVSLDTRWNRRTDQGEFARVVYLGKVVKNDVLHLEVDLNETRTIMDYNIGQPSDDCDSETDGENNAWYKFGYSERDIYESKNGIPGEFEHIVKGGTNSIKVSIGLSENAREYEISLWPDTATAGSEKTVVVNASDLAANNGIVNINRKTEDKDKNSIGLITGGRYEVSVKALGMAYGVPVSTESMRNNADNDADNDLRFADVTDVSAGVNSGGFTYSSSGGNNSLAVRISEAANAEFYLIRLTGPQNYSSGQDTENTYLAHSGYNVISIENPELSVDEQIEDPGVFKIQVFGINNNSITGEEPDLNIARQSDSGLKFITVNFDRFANQKTEMPVLSSELYRPGAIDLEVNFNDGSGWYRLMLVSNDYGERKIDCRFTNYMEYNRQKFHVEFKPPSGTSSTDNVFAGGSEEVDLYIRTVPENRYRDTFWLKEYIGDYNASLPAIYFDSFYDNFAHYWINRPESDATNVDDMVSHFALWDTGQIIDTDTGFAMKNVTMNDVFFAPLVYRKLTLKAGFVEEMSSDITQEITPPVYTARACDPEEGETGSIKLTITQAHIANYCEVFWKPGNEPVELDSINLNEWSQSEPVNIEANGGITEYTIEGLTPNRGYVIAVRGANQNGLSKVSVQGPVVPYSNVKPETAPSVALNLGADGKSIVVSGIHVAGQCRYRVYWKGETKTTWNCYDTLTDGGSYKFESFSYRITGLDEWDKYHVRVCALSPADEAEDGAFSDTLQLEGGTEFNSAIAPEISLETMQLDQGRRGILVTGLNVPGDVQYRIFWKYKINDPWTKDGDTAESTYIIEDVANFSRYYVMALAFFDNNDENPENDIIGKPSEYRVIYIINNQEIVCHMEWYDVERVGGIVRAGLKVVIDKFPEGIDIYDCESNVFYYCGNAALKFVDDKCFYPLDEMGNDSFLVNYSGLTTSNYEFILLSQRDIMKLNDYGFPLYAYYLFPIINIDFSFFNEHNDMSDIHIILESSTEYGSEFWQEN